jgi:hypothetical protein
MSVPILWRQDLAGLPLKINNKKVGPQKLFLSFYVVDCTDEHLEKCQVSEDTWINVK